MIITKVTRSYSKSINTKNYGILESWIKIEAVYEAQIESGDDPVKVAAMIAKQAQDEVIANTNEVVAKIKESAARMQNMAAGNTGAAPSAPAAATTEPRAL